MEWPQCEFSCIVGVRVAQSEGKILKLKVSLGHKQTFEKIYFVRTGNPRSLETKHKFIFFCSQNDSIFTALR